MSAQIPVDEWLPYTTVEERAEILLLNRDLLWEILPFLTLEERLEVRDALGLLWLPQPGPQTDALLSKADWLYYGGQAGGGKSDLGIGLSLLFHKVSAFFRRQYTDLQDVIDRSKEIIGMDGSKGKYNGNQHTWYHLPGGSSLKFGAMQREDHKNKWQGRPHDLYVFDEAPQFSRTQVEYVTGWNRSVDPYQRCRVVLTGNPPGDAEGEWVIEMFAPWLDPHHPRPALPGELRWYIYLPKDRVYKEVPDGSPVEYETDDGTEILYPRSRTFIPASLEDNAYLRSTTYKSVLQNMPEPWRSRLLKGDFTAGRDDDARQLIPSKWIKAAQDRWREREQPLLPMTALGVDPARGGDCKTCLAPRYGSYFSEIEKHSGRSTPDGPSVVTLMKAALLRGKADTNTEVNLDLIGIGTSVYDFGTASKMEINPINVAEGTDETNRTGHFGFRNIRAAMWWKFREALDPDTGDEIALPPDPELAADLSAPRFSVTISGIQVESKDDIIDRIGRSPDVGDAVVLASWIPDKPRILSW